MYNTTTEFYCFNPIGCLALIRDSRQINVHNVDLLRQIATQINIIAFKRLY